MVNDSSVLLIFNFEFNFFLNQNHTTMKTLQALLFLFGFLSCSASAQRVYTLADTAFANHLLKESISLIEKKKFDLAYAKADTAQIIFEQALGKETKEVADALHLKGRNLGFKNKLSESLSLFEKSLAIRLRIFGEYHVDIASSYYSIGIYHYNKVEYNKTVTYCQKAVDILDSIHMNLPANYQYGTIAQAYGFTGNYNKSIIYLLRGLDILQKKGDSNRIHLYLLNIADNYGILGDNNNAIKYGEQSLNFQLKMARPNNFTIVGAYITIGNGYSNKGEYEKANNFYLKALNLIERGNINNEALKGMLLNNIGNNYASQGEYDKSIEYVQKALDIDLESPQSPEKDGLIFKNYTVLGSSYYGKEDFNKAIDYFQKALDVGLKTFDAKDSRIAFAYKNLGRTYLDKGDFNKAEDYFKKALSIFESKFDQADVFKSLAVLQMKLGAYSQADSLFQKSLSFTNFTNSQNLGNITELGDVGIDILLKKAEFERIWYKETKDIAHLNQSIQTYQNAIAVIDYIKKTFTTEGSKTLLQDRTYPIYEGAMQTNLLLSDLNESNNLKKQSFDYSEQSKSSLLQAQIRESDALKYAGIPDNLLQKENDLRTHIADYDKQRHEKINDGKTETDSTILVITSILFDLHQQYDTLKQNFEKNYSDYYRLKYDFNTLKVADIQQKILSPQQTMLSYFVGDSAVFAFLIRNDTFAVFEMKKDFPLEAWVKQLRDGLYSYHTAAVKTEKLYDAKADSFAMASYQLYQKLITPLSNLLTKEVVIVPDGVLGYVPFDVLLATKPKDATKFSTHDYFGKNYIISYNYSATLWQEMRNRRHKLEPQKPFIGFAPYFNGDTTLLSKLFADDVAMRKGLDSLKYSGEEVFKAQKLMQGETILNKKATKRVFEEIAPNYRIVHLATHGKANDKIGDYCFLAFTEQKDSLENALLYVRDIYNLSLNADLVVLSACETGIGELKRGEGIVSLSRAFAYAGAKSLVTTLWSVNDKSTMQIMEDFYRQLKKGKTKDYALWKAKQDYLEKAKNDLAHPFFWSAFIPIGDMSAVKK